MALMLLRVNFSSALTRDVSKLVRIYVQESLNLNAAYQIDEKNCHYITSVMRLKVGSSFRIFNGRDGEFLCDLEAIAKNKKSAQGMITKQIREQQDDRRLPVVLYCAPLKKPRMKLLLEKLTELGVQDVVLVKTQNVNAEYDDEESLASLVRVCVESAEQCERLSVPRVMKAISFQQLSSQGGDMAGSGVEARRLLVCRERFPGGEPLLRALLGPSEAEGPSSRADPGFGADCPPVSIFVGPEGGFTAVELESMQALSETFRFVTLGDSVLRAETAAISAVSTVGAALDFMAYRDRL